MAQAFAVLALLSQLFAAMFLLIYAFCLDLLRDKRMAAVFFVLNITACTGKPFHIHTQTRTQANVHYLVFCFYSLIMRN